MEWLDRDFVNVSKNVHVLIGGEWLAEIHKLWPPRIIANIATRTLTIRAATVRRGVLTSSCVLILALVDAFET